MTRYKAFFFIIAMSTFSGCSLLPFSSGEPVKKYTLGYPYIAPNVLDMKDTHLLIDIPSVYPPLDTLRIAIRPTERSIDYMADGEWANRLGVLIQESFVYAFENTNVLGSVSRPSEGVRVNKSLKIEIRGFEIDQFSQSPKRLAHIDYLAQLADMPSRRVIAFQSFRESIPIEIENLEAYVAALNQAHLKATERITAWTLKSLQNK